MTAARKSEPKSQYQDLIHENWRDQLTIVEDPLPENLEIDPAKTILVCKDKDPVYILQLALEKGIQQVVQANTIDFEKELNASCLMLADQKRWLDYPISAILDPKNANQENEVDKLLINIEFKKAKEKIGLLRAIEDQLMDLSSSQTFRGEVLGVADELITNAVFNAPFVNKDNSESGEERTVKETKMTRGKAGRLFLGHDESRLVVGCYDPYGTLNVRRLFERVKDCYVDGVARNINMGKGGAGIGSFMVYNSSSSYYAAVRGGFATQICCTVPLKLSSRKRSLVAKNLHYFHV